MVEVQIDTVSFLAVPFGSIALDIPDFGRYRRFRAELTEIAVDGQTGVDRCLTCGIDTILSDEEHDLECTFHTVKF